MDGVNRREFLVGSLVAVSWTALGAAGTILAQQLPVSAGPGAPELIDDLVAANRILALEGVVDAFGHVSVRHNRDPNRFFLSPLAGSCARHGRRSHRIRSREQRGRCERPRPVFRAIHPRGDLQGASRCSLRRPRACAVRRAVRRHHRAASPRVPYGRLHRRQRSHLRYSQDRGHDRHAGEDAARGRALAQALGTNPPC